MRIPALVSRKMLHLLKLLCEILALDSFCGNDL
jgi:hypothetical protein